MTLAETVQAQQPAVLEDLARLVAIQSVSADAGRAGLVEASAETVATLLTDLGCPDVRVVRAGGGRPARGGPPPLVQPAVRGAAARRPPLRPRHCRRQGRAGRPPGGAARVRRP